MLGSLRVIAGVGLLAAVSAASAQTAPAAPAASAAPAPAAEARPPRIPALNFTKGSGLSDFTISPDGSKFAMRVTSGGKTSIAVLDAVTRNSLHRLNVPEKNGLEWIRWAGDSKLLISMSGIGNWEGDDVRITRLYYYDLGTKAFVYIGKAGMGVTGDDVIHVDPAGEFVLLSVQRSVFEYPSVWRYPLNANAAKEAKSVQDPKTDVWDWYADGSGVVRMGFAYPGPGRLKIFYRRAAPDPLREIARLTEDNVDEQIWDVARIVSGSDEGLVLKPGDDGRVAVRKFNYATRTVGETVYTVPGWDISDVGFDDNDQLRAVYYTDDRDRVVWFEPKMKSLQARLDKAMQGEEVWVFSRAKDGSRMLVWSGSASNPGSTYIYDAKKATLDIFASSLPDLDPAQLAAPKPVSYPARDKTRIAAYLTLPRGRPAKGLPLIILPHGGPYGVRDKLDFSSEVQFLANRGYAVLQPNYRGSGGYGEAFEKLGEGQIGRAMQDDLDDAMDWAVTEGFADPKRVCVVGSSYGGYAALWAVIRNPDRYRCAASFAGVTDWKKQLKYNSGFLSSKGARKWRATVVGENAKFDLDTVSPLAQVTRLTRPVLLAHGKEDYTVPFRQFTALSEASARAGKPIETLIFEEEGHGFASPENEAKWLETLEAFLTKNNPAD